MSLPEFASVGPGPIHIKVPEQHTSYYSDSGRTILVEADDRFQIGPDRVFGDLLDSASEVSYCMMCYVRNEETLCATAEYQVVICEQCGDKLRGSYPRHRNTKRDIYIETYPVSASNYRCAFCWDRILVGDNCLYLPLCETHCK